MPSTRIAELNAFVLNEQGVYQAPDADHEFSYSDGESTEAALREILSSAEDLSSDSTELQSKIVDWPTEYHLSKARANLLRALDLSSVKRVLELGCGCGAITRYLGEQGPDQNQPISVDSIEGSPTRAALARMRCKDLDNVQISVANFNDVQVPDAQYDLVLFVGVTEYAGRFSQADTDEQALQELLAMGRKACKQGGVVLVAIENRLGLKYALGACEDHYAVPYVGIDEYPNADGIKTYSKAEWEEQISKAGFTYSQLMLPFPDYKIPTVVAHQNGPAKQIVSALEGLKSRDYSRHFELAPAEQKAWSALAQSGSLALHSNSFLWLLSNSERELRELSGPACSTFDVHSFDYPDFVAQPRPNETRLIENLHAEIIQLKSHANNLEGKVALMQNSIGWRFLNPIRRLFGKTTL